MTVNNFITEFHFTAINMTVGYTTTVEYHDVIYSVKKLGPMRFEIL